MSTKTYNGNSTISLNFGGSSSTDNVLQVKNITYYNIHFIKESKV